MDKSSFEFHPLRTVGFGLLGFVLGLTLLLIVGGIFITPQWGDGIAVQAFSFGLTVGGVSGAMWGLAEKSRRHVLRLAAAAGVGGGAGYLVFSILAQGMDAAIGPNTYWWFPLLKIFIKLSPIGVCLGAGLGWAVNGWRSSARLAAYGMLASIFGTLVFSCWFLIPGLVNPNLSFFSDLLQLLFLWAVLGLALTRERPAGMSTSASPHLISEPEVFMNSVATSDSNASDKRHMRISLLLLGGLLFLRFPFLITAAFLPFGRTAAYIVDLAGTYTLTAVLIWWERERLRDFWIDLAGAIVFLCQTFCFPIGIGLFAAMRRSKVKFPSPPKNLFRWMLLGAILAIGADLFIMYAGLEPSNPRSLQSASLFFLISAGLVQMTNAAVMEEPLFRGFLWGYLRKARWNNVWIWLFQAALFTAGHIYYLSTEPFFPWLIRMMIPSLLIGFVAWRSRSIAASMVAHGFFNAAGDMLLHTSSLAGAYAVAWTALVILGIVLAVIFIIDFFRKRGRLADVVREVAG
jgi:membrane protease YdiL (CAAX protease family)